MVITSLHMHNHAHSVGDISRVISAHVIGMFGFSVLSGRLADRFGRGPVILAGTATLILACLVAPLSPDVLPLGVALFLLGLGWNFCFVGGSALLADQLSPDERARTQGFNDLLIGLVSAAGSLGSGFIFGTGGYQVVGIAGALAAVVPLSLVVWWQVTRPRMAPAH
jgi:MFS family permease